MAAFDSTTRLGTPTLGRPPRRVGLQRELALLGPLAQLRAGRLPRRLGQLLVGLTLYGLTLAMVIRASLGNSPWDVLHQGLARHLPISIGTAVIAMSLVVLLAWIPLREMPGLGTVLNSVLVGLSADFFLGVIDTPAAAGARTALLLGGVLLNAVATALYIGSQFGPGPRDGLMTGLHRRTGISIQLVRAALEISVVALGFLLGGRVGLGTVLYAVAIGPLVQRLLPLAIVDLPARSIPTSTPRRATRTSLEDADGSCSGPCGPDPEPVAA
jgi:uncharacterized membrane protein YczE